MVNKTNAHALTLSDGTGVDFDVAALRKDVKTRRQLREITKIPGTSEAYDHLMAKYCNLDFDEISDLSNPDWKALNDAFNVAMQELFNPNSN
jgi:hypothetical protein